MNVAMAFSVEHAPLRRMKRSEYLYLAEQGAFRDQRVELLFGMVVEMSPIGPAHSQSVALIMETLFAQLGDRAHVQCQSTFDATVDSLPEPDICVTEPGTYWRSYVSRSLLIIEVADSSLAYDRNEKAALYALCNVDEYWIVNTRDGEVEVRRDRDPSQGTWRSLTTHDRGEVIHPLAFPDVAIAVSEIVPPA